MKRPSVSLACILKNEKVNLPLFLESVKDCFDEIHFTDTGSEDGSIELIEGYKSQNPADTPIFLHHFEWVNDFSEARNFSFSHPKTEYVAWMDLDDVLVGKEAFIEWRDNLMNIADAWLATYHYASDASGKPTCSFARERVIRRSTQMKWKYFVHEGLIPPVGKSISMQYASSWNITHKRDAEDARTDKSRNLKLFQGKKLDARMRYYYGKELFEAQKPLEAFSELIKAVAEDSLESHDRLMGIQYACFSAMQLNQFDKAIQLAFQGLQLDPLRAEYYVIIADSYLRLGKLLEANNFYLAASNCRFPDPSLTATALYNHEDSYRHYPLNQLARISANIGEIEKAEKYIEQALLYGPHFETLGIKKDLDDLKLKVGSSKLIKKEKTDEIVISTPPQGFYEWDEAIYKEKGIGGSETAAVEMARHLSDMTGRKVLVFNPRKEEKHFGKVSYLPASEVVPYFSKYEPKVHIAWRHNTKLTDAPTYLWCHDLIAQGLEKHENFEKVFVLSQFHKTLVKNMFKVPESKIWVTRNGLEPVRFKDLKEEKEFGKVVFSSSPDRGLDRALYVMDEVIKTYPEAKLHIFYGFENMKKAGRQKEVDTLELLISKRPYAIFHGNISQAKLTEEFASACVWLYPTNFLETYCITAIEALASKMYPVVRDYGALSDTLKGAPADIIESNCVTKEEIAVYANAVCAALKEKKWEKMDVSLEALSWEGVAKSWVEFLSL